MESLIAKTGKLRSLVRELESKYDDKAAVSYMPQPVFVPSCMSKSELPPSWTQLCPIGRQPRCVISLQQQIAKVDEAYDRCNQVWAKGEVEGFLTETFLQLKI